VNAAIWSPCDPPIERDILAEREDEQIETEVQSRIAHARDIELADIVLDDETPGSVDCAARRVLGAVIRKALKQMRAQLTDDERTMTDYIVECFDSEARDGRLADEMLEARNA